MDLGDLRHDYETAGLAEHEVSDDPIEQFGRWFSDAADSTIYEPNAMVVATVDASGAPSVRNVLLKAFDERGFVFYTNYASQKVQELDANDRAALIFSWLELNRQVRVQGRTERITVQESDDYFARRPRGSQIGAWASAQSTVIGGRDELDAQWAATEQRFAGAEVTRPAHWGGVRVVPDRIEFWQGRRNRLHDRLRASRADAPEPDTAIWFWERLSP